MSQTISKHIGEGFGKGELYAALAYDATDAFGGMKIKALMLNSTGRISFLDADAYIYASSTGVLELKATTINLAGVATFAVQDIHTLGLTVASAKAVVQGMNTFPKLTPTILTSGAGYTMTAAQMLSGLIRDTSSTGAIAATLPTVAAVVALIGGYVAGTSFYLDYSNPGNQTVTLTVDASAQWTMTGTMTIATTTHRRFLCVINSATTGTVYSIGDAAA